MVFTQIYFFKLLTEKNVKGQLTECYMDGCRVCNGIERGTRPRAGGIAVKEEQPLCCSRRKLSYNVVSKEKTFMCREIIVNRKTGL